MANSIKVKRSATPSAIPTTVQLELGELAINTYDGKIFIKKDNGTASVIEIGAGSGTVTSVAALTLGTTGTDLSSTVANSTTTPVITLQVPTASATNRGALSSTDWSTFNNKGSGTVTSVTGTAPVASSGGTTPAISMAAATTSVNGYLTSTDWTTFNNKGSGTVTAVSVATANGVSGSSSGGATPALTIALGSITPSAVQVSGLTASEILSTDASKNLTSLAVATYPSLTELAYVKGVTSAIQTQINAKGTGTVTSVAATVPSVLSISGSPITTSGTLAITYSGTALPVANGGTSLTTLTANSVILGNGASAPTFVAPSTSGNLLTSNGTTWASTAPAASSISLSNDTSTATTLYPTFASATTGTTSTVYTSNSKLLYKPSTGELSVTAPIASNGLVLNATTVGSSYTIAAGYNASSVGPITVSSGVAVTITSGQRWLVL